MRTVRQRLEGCTTAGGQLFRRDDLPASRGFGPLLFEDELSSIHLGIGSISLFFRRCQILFELSHARGLFPGRYLHHRGVGLGIAIHLGLGGVVEEGVETVVLLLGDGVELVLVALGATGGQAEEHRRKGVGPVDRVDHPILVIDRAALAGGRMRSNESAGDLILELRLGEQISGELTDDELIERWVLVEQFDDAITVGPHLTIVVEMQAVSVGVARRIEPHTSPVFAESFRGQQSIEQSFPGVRVGVGDEGIDLFDGGRETSEIESGPADQGFPVGPLLPGKLLLFEVGTDEGVDRLWRRVPTDGGGIRSKW